MRLLFVFTPKARERKKEENQNCVQDPRDVSRSCESFDGSALAGCWLRAVGCLGGDIVVLSLSRSPPPTSLSPLSSSDHDRRFRGDFSAGLSSSIFVLPLRQPEHQPAARVDRRPRRHPHGGSPLGERKVKLMCACGCFFMQKVVSFFFLCPFQIAFGAQKASKNKTS